MQKERYHLETGGQGAIPMLSLSRAQPERIMFIPPLVGGSSALEVKKFRYFLRSCRILSFDYGGHGDEAETTFSLKKSIEEASRALEHAIERSRQEDLPLHVTGTCYSSIPLMFAVQKHYSEGNISSMMNVNGLLSSQDILSFEGYAPFLAKKGREYSSKEEFRDALKEDEARTERSIYLSALTEYLNRIFPDIADMISDTRFGQLAYDRTDYPDTFLEFMDLDTSSLRIPAELPCLFFYGIHDDIMGLDDRTQRETYVERASRIAPNLEVEPIAVDHFANGPDHYVIGEKGLAFFTKHEEGTGNPMS